MRNYLQRGDVISIAAPAGGVLSCQGILIGNLFGIAATDAAEGQTFELATRGVYNLPKAANVALAAGDRVSWDAANNQIVAPAAGMAPVGIVVLAAANGTTSVRVRLDGVSTVVQA
jgi:predicted RecA/RadA family phage recombinase